MLARVETVLEKARTDVDNLTYIPVSLADRAGKVSPERDASTVKAQSPGVTKVSPSVAKVSRSNSARVKSPVDIVSSSPHGKSVTLRRSASSASKVTSENDRQQQVTRNGTKSPATNGSDFQTLKKVKDNKVNYQSTLLKMF